jgi:hypothetical protein
MKLKHIFENQQWDTSRMSRQEIWDDLSDLFTIQHYTGREIDIDIDPQGQIHMFGANLVSKSNTLKHMPVKLGVVNSLSARGLNTLADLPSVCMDYLEIKWFTGQDLTSATPVKLGSDTHLGRLYLSDCFNLKTLNGIDQFTSLVENREVRVRIENCFNLAFDPYDYLNYVEIEFYLMVPRNVQLVKAIALSNSGHIRFDYLEDKKLMAIISKWRSRGPAAMIPLARELIAAGYTHHVRPT